MWGALFAFVCIDIPIRETQSAVITALRNAFLLGTDAIIPSNSMTQPI